MRQEAFSSFAVNYARMVGSRGVFVTFGGDMAFTDGRRINLPTLPAGTFLSPWEVKVFTGYLDHELGHIKFTDFKQLKASGLNRAKEPILFYLWNMVEDIRIENEYIRRWPSTAAYLDACTQDVETRKRTREETQSRRAVQSMVFLEAMNRTCYEDLRSTKDVEFFSPIKMEAIPELKEAERLLRVGVPRLSSEVESLNLARAVLTSFPKDVDWGQATALDEQGCIHLVFLVDGENSGNGGSLESAALLLLSFNDRGEAQHQAYQVVEEKDLPGSKKPPPIKKKGKVAPVRGFENDGTVILPPVCTQGDEIFRPADRDAAVYHKTREKVQTEITSLKRMLGIYLQSRNKKAWERGLLEGRLDEERLALFEAGAVDLFKQKRDRQVVNTAISKMIDESGSMDEENARVGAIMLCEALVGIKEVKLAISGFTTNEKRYHEKSGGGRNEGLSILLYKGFEESYESCKDKLGTLGSRLRTPLGEAYAFAYQQVSVRPEPRKVIWLTTDGLPSISVGNNEHSEWLLMERIYQRCKRQGIKVICTNIGGINERMKTVADMVVTVNSSAEYPNSILMSLKEIM